MREALADFDAVLAADPDHLNALAFRANALLGLAGETAHGGGDARDLYREAMRTLDRAALLWPENASLQTGRGIAFRGLAGADEREGQDPVPRLEEALEAFHEALERDPDSVYALGNLSTTHNSVADALRARGEESIRHVETARDFARKALAIDPGAANALNALGNALRDLADHRLAHTGDAGELYGESLDAYRKAVETAPGFWKAHANAGILLLNLCRYGEAADSFRRALATGGERHPPLRAWLRNAEFGARMGWQGIRFRADQDLRQGSWASARLRFERALEAAASGDKPIEGSNAQLLSRSRVQLAGLYAQASAGNFGGERTDIPVAQEKARAWRARAMDLLEEARRENLVDPAAVRGDGMLAPLRGHGPFEDLLERWETGEGK